jgi:hypothetical protein
MVVFTATNTTRPGSAPVNRIAPAEFNPIQPTRVRTHPKST